MYLLYNHFNYYYYYLVVLYLFSKFSKLNTIPKSFLLCTTKLRILFITHFPFQHLTPWGKDVWAACLNLLHNNFVYQNFLLEVVLCVIMQVVFANITPNGMWIFAQWDSKRQLITHFLQSPSVLKMLVEICSNLLHKSFKSKICFGGGILFGLQTFLS